MTGAVPQNTGAAPQYYLECSNPRCAIGRAHDVVGDIPRGPQLVPVSAGVPIAFCEVECLMATLEPVRHPMLRRCPTCDGIMAIPIFGYGEVCIQCAC